MQRFDVHAHAVAPGTDVASLPAAQALMKREGFAGSIPGAGWSVDGALRFMDEQGIALQLLSMPGALDAEQARTWNERTAGIVAAHPDRFGLLAALPMADPDRAIEEIRYATDQLHADGFVLATNYDGVYFGDARFEPAFAELDRHRLPVFVHPVLPPAFDRLGLGRPGPLIEYPMDTARTIVDAIFAGVLLRHRNLRLVLAHAGGVLPTLQDRIALAGPEPWVANPLRLTSEQLTEQLRGLYLDTAIGGGPAGIVPAVQMVGVDHLVFGTDYPPAGIDIITATSKNLGNTLDRAGQQQLEAAFARLFPAAAARAEHDR
ncbi:amidohydrolase family protein [Amycolatopsis sp. NPDC059090]|uniref:amidohydrolase family protein n=1 Tax=unclassified Amycolatopsis TaxID=2618356 RepID=UPI00366EFB1A